MSRTRRVVLSARDPGGVGHVLALAEAFRARGNDTRVVASGVALRMLRGGGEIVQPFEFGGSRDFVEVGAPMHELLGAARAVLDEIQPDLVLGSLSSYGVGVDEALVAVARCPTFVMQDFWGDANLGLGVAAGLYLALDEFAVEVTRQRWGLPAVAVGSPKHSRYARCDVARMRREARSELGVTDGQVIIGFFAQSPDIPGHESAFQELARAVASLRGPVFLLRQHLKFQHRRAEQIAFLTDLGLRVIDVSDRDRAEPWLAACDVVATPFSLSALDHAYLSAYSTEPIGVVLFLLPNQEIQAFMERSCGFGQFPTVDRGLGTVVRSASSTAPLLVAALAPSAVDRYYQASQALRADDACERVLAVVERVCEAA